MAKRTTDDRGRLLPRCNARVAAGVPDGTAYRTEWIDFDRGLRVGNLEKHERITQILKYLLEQRFQQPFVCDRWGRGSFWQWICWVPRRNREAKPVSSNVNFSCAKLYISADREERVFESGFQVERGPVTGPERYPGCRLKPDWDWNQLVRWLRKGTVLDQELARLLKREGFRVNIGGWEALGTFDASNFKSAGQLRRLVRKIPDDAWIGFQLFYPLPEDEVRAMSGYELVQAVMGVFTEVTRALNQVLSVPLPETVHPSLSLRVKA